jgi:ACS family tartrate transporter-like MFS transporter
MRFALGLAEAGFFPGIILYLSFWFPARHRAGVTAIFMAAAPLSSMVGSPISGAIMEMNGFLLLGGWQWLFLLEAAPTVLLGIASYFYLTDKPHEATRLKQDELRRHDARRFVADCSRRRAEEGGDVSPQDGVVHENDRRRSGV